MIILKIVCYNAKKRIKDFWLEEYKIIGFSEQELNNDEMVISNKLEHQKNFFYVWIQEDFTTNPEIDEFEIYFSEQNI